MPGGVRGLLRPDDEALRLILSPTPPRVLVAVAHPDDETVGAGLLLSRLPDVWIVHATDGAPRDPRFMARGFEGSREEYARLRRTELEAAMGRIGIAPDRLLSIGIPDQEAVFEIPRLVAELTGLIRDLQPGVVLTLPYEGGHPDHDAVALAVRLANPPAMVEVALYHAHPGTERMVVNEFLPGPPEVCLAPFPLKEELIACFASQRETLQAFLPPRPERFRSAPAYDFSRPPHEGRLQYELWGFPITGTSWRLQAKIGAGVAQLQS